MKPLTTLTTFITSDGRLNQADGLNIFRLGSAPSARLTSDRLTTIPLCLLFILVIALSQAGCASSPAISDELFLRGHYHVPLSVPAESLSSTPEKSGMFGRENLSITGTFKFSDRQFQDFMERSQVATTWVALPVPERTLCPLYDIDRFRQANLKQFDIVTKGYFLCETTRGAGLLKEGTTFFKCPPGNPEGDFMLGVVDINRKVLTVVLKQDF